MITKIRENLYLGDSGAELDLPYVAVTFDLSGWSFDLDPIVGDYFLIHNLVSHISSILDSNIPVLVKCHESIDRSPFIIACFLWFDSYCKEQDITGLQAYEEVKRLHPVTFIHDDWMNLYLGKESSTIKQTKRTGE